MTAASKAGRKPVAPRLAIVAMVRATGSIKAVADWYGVNRHSIHRHIRNHERLTGEWVERRGPGRPRINAGGDQ